MLFVPIERPNTYGTISQRAHARTVALPLEPDNEDVAEQTSNAGNRAFANDHLSPGAIGQVSLSQAPEPEFRGVAGSGHSSMAK